MTKEEEIRSLVGEQLMQREAALIEGEKRLRDLMGFIKATLIDAQRANAWHFIESRLADKGSMQMRTDAMFKQKAKDVLV